MTSAPALEHAGTSRTGEARRVVIVGGGISGLSAAWYLERYARDGDVDVQYMLVESSPRWGGKVLTETVAGDGIDPFVVEAGPDAFLTQKPWALELARDLGLDAHLIGMNEQAGGVYVLDHGQPVAMPDGVMLVVPTRFWPFVRSSLISLHGKLRMAMDLFIRPRRDDGDETLAAFTRRRLGNEALDKIAEPLMAGIYNADAEEQSIMATFPRFRQLEKEHGSLIRGMVASRLPRASRTTSETPAAKVPMFMSLQGGTEELIDALVPRLTGDLRLGTRVLAVNQAPDGSYRVALDPGGVVHADAVILTTPAYTTADLVRAFAPEAADQLGGIRYVGTGTVSLAYHAQEITRPLHGVGLVVPKGEERPINAITISSTKFDHRAPAGHVLLRVFFGGSRSPETMGYDDARLLQVVRDELREILGIDAEPVFVRIYRWPRANPQYGVGHLERVARIEAALPDGLYVTGGAYRGVGMPDCVFQARSTAGQVMDRLKQIHGAGREAGA